MLCLSAGMNWHPMDNILINGFNIDQETNIWFKNCIDNLNAQKQTWNNAVKDELSLHDFLYENFYKN